MQAPYFGPSLVKNEVLASSTFGGCLRPFGGDLPSLLLVPGVVDQVEAPNYTIGGNSVAEPDQPDDGVIHCRLISFNEGMGEWHFLSVILLADCQPR
ncbi:hypothetical protein [Streptomyces sp. NPDC002573]|uniref:hypothetical protein n=1 Tax=Streptomyces sp. NPDC002573 TaxID=3364651 RepID=UPI00367AD9BD